MADIGVDTASNRKEVESLEKQYPELVALMKRQLREHEALLRTGNTITEIRIESVYKKQENGTVKVVGERKSTVEVDVWDMFSPAYDTPEGEALRKARKTAMTEMRKRHDAEYEELRAKLNGPQRGEFFLIIEDI